MCLGGGSRMGAAAARCIVLIFRDGLGLLLQQKEKNQVPPLFFFSSPFFFPLMLSSPFQMGSVPTHVA